MKVTYRFLVLALLTGFFLSACGEKAAVDEMPAEMPAVEEMAESATEAVEEMAESATEAVEEMASDEPGGYVPTADELVPGETRP
jgi:outer membrane lipoprotein-sorting protein